MNKKKKGKLRSSFINKTKFFNIKFLSFSVLIFLEQLDCILVKKIKMLRFVEKTLDSYYIYFIINNFLNIYLGFRKQSWAVSCLIIC